MALEECAATLLPFISSGISVIADAHVAQISTNLPSWLHAQMPQKKMRKLEWEMGYLVNLKIARTVQQSPTLLLVTIKAYCGRTTDEGALAGQIASLKTMEGRGGNC